MSLKKKKKKTLQIQCCIPVLNKIPVTKSFPIHLGPWDSGVKEVSHQGLRLFRSLSHYFCGLLPSFILTNINLILSLVADKFSLLKNCHELIDETIPDLVSSDLLGLGPKLALVSSTGIACGFPVHCFFLWSFKINFLMTCRSLGVFLPAHQVQS